MGIVTCIWYKNGLFMSMLDDNNKWGPPFLLSDSATPDFSAVLMSDDDIYTCFVDYSGRLLYMNACEEKKEPIVILESRISGTYPYNVRLVEADGYIHAFYVVSHNRKQLLTYQKIDGRQNEMPEVEGIIIKEGKNFAVCSDGIDIHLFFLTNVQDVNLLVHRRISGGRTSKPVTTPFEYDSSLKLQAAKAKDGPIYILAASDECKGKSIIYKFDPIINKFSKSLEVYNNSSGHGCDSLIIIKDNPYIVRSLKSSFVFARISRDLKCVADESKIDLSGRDIALKCKYQSNNNKEKNFKCDYTPMLFGSGLKFPFDLKTLSMQKKDDDYNDKDALHEHILALEERIGFLENTIREILRP